MPLVRNQADLHRHWRALMGRLGFSQPRLYLQLFLRTLWMSLVITLLCARAVHWARHRDQARAHLLDPAHMDFGKS